MLPDPKFLEPSDIHVVLRPPVGRAGGELGRTRQQSGEVIIHGLDSRDLDGHIEVTDHVLIKEEPIRVGPRPTAQG